MYLGFLTENERKHPSGKGFWFLQKKNERIQEAKKSFT